jgi:indolepyruvate ferredoxin oxidoreductase, beta subunit
MRTLSYNIIVAGLGGQGVNTLTKILFELCHAQSLPCQGAIFKGGAQKAGTIHSELKIFAAGQHDHIRCSNQILKGSLNLMLGLEPHEALRFAAFFNPGTNLIINDVPVPFYSERSTGRKPPDPIGQLTPVYPHLIARDFSAIAQGEYGDRRMAGLLMLREAAAADDFPVGRSAIDELIGARSAEPDTSKHTEGK